MIGLGWLSVVPAHLAASRPATQFVTDLGSDKVTSIRYDQKTRSLRWHDGGIRWYAADLKLGRPPIGGSPAGLSLGGSQIEGDSLDNEADRNWLNTALDANGLLRRLDLVDWSGDEAWVSPAPWRGLPLVAGIAAILSFFLMLGRDQRRFGTRWAWFWMFALVGWGIAPALVLLLEPTPLWRRTMSAFPAKPLLAGGRGFVVALVLKGCLAFLGRLCFSY
ncbi:MAG: hypothetical protein QOJ11_1474 [Frankiales bacterium]|nr:hypothetical protein [Frankiales bacterium]